MILNRYDAVKLRRDYPGASFRPLDPGETWQAGKLYFCGYWHKAFRVVEIQEEVPVWGTVYRVLWSDGTENAHSTRPDPRYDFEIVPAAGREEVES